MEEVKILVMALVSFLSQEQIPIVAKSAEIHIDRQYRQINVHQYDLVGIRQYQNMAKAGLDTLMKSKHLREDMAPLRLANVRFYEDEGKLNAVLNLHYDTLKDLRKMSFYVDGDATLSYPYMKGYRYGLETGRVDDRYVRFAAEEEVGFHMSFEEIPKDGSYSLLDDWYALTAKEYLDVSEQFSVKDFKALRELILKKETGRSFRNIENNNPYHSFDGFSAFLASTPRNYDHNIRLPIREYHNLVLWGKGQFSLHLFDGYLENTNPYLDNDTVYFHKATNLEETTLFNYLKELKQALKE